MRDIVIPYLPTNSGELDACIALIEKNVPHRKIYVIEEKFSDTSHVDQILKLRHAILSIDLTDDFYLFNDDFFVIKPVTEIPYYHKGLLTYHHRRTGWLPYKKAIKNTLDYLPEGSLSYEVHIPMLFNQHKLLKLIEKIEPLIAQNKCPLIRSTYANTYDIQGELIADVKNIKDFRDKTYLSTDERSFNMAIGQYIRGQL